MGGIRISTNELEKELEGYGEISVKWSRNVLCWGQQEI